MRLLTVSAKYGGVSTVLLSSDSSYLLWEILPNSWCVTILYDVVFLLSTDCLSADNLFFLVNYLLVYEQHIQFVR
jgi:hypothetical protein